MQCTTDKHIPVYIVLQQRYCIQFKIPFQYAYYQTPVELLRFKDRAKRQTIFVEGAFRNPHCPQ